ncbi:MAG: hypothetical protein WD749_05215 [Phycisphaerales bacterium]
MNPATVEPDHTANVGVPFEQEIEGVLGELRPALAAILEGLRPPVMRASELQRLLGLDKKLSWSVYSAATTPDARALASLLPGRRAMERFFAASAQRGVPGAAIDRARAMYRRFEESVATHAGSRDAFETMVSEFGGAEREAGRGGGGGAADLKHKRAAFRATSLLWGRQARVVCGARIMHPSAGPGGAGLLDTVFIKGMAGVRRTRRSVPLHTTAYRARTVQPGGPAVVSPPEPLDPRETGPDAIGLLRDFCSRPLPEFRLRVSAQGYRCHELVSEHVGPSGEVTYFTGEAGRADTGVPGSVEGGGGWELSLAKSVDIPIEVFMADVLMHRSVWGKRPPEVRVYATPMDGSLEFRETDLLPLAERAEYLGEGADAARTPLLPRYAEMLRYATDRMGWNVEEFRVFRCRVDYPLLYSRIRVTLR